MGDTEKVHLAVQEAWDAVSRVDLPEALQLVAFERALDVSLASAGLQADEVHPAPPLPSTRELVPSNRYAATEVAAIAQKSGLSTEDVKQVYRVDDGKLSLVVSARKIDESAARGSREITLLIAAGRQAAGIDDEWTALSEAREWCSRYSRLDSNNYASAILAMDSEFSFSGTGVGRQVRLTMPGWDAWTDLMEHLVGQEA